MRIMLVEDHFDTLEVLERLLTKAGHSVRCAKGAAEAIALCKTDGVDLFICDIALPDGDGWNLMKHMHEFCPAPGIAYTGFGMAADVERSRECGFCVHLTKPARFEALLAAIATACPDKSAVVHSSD
jgi:CheY-like chemotaxis protein